MRIVRTAYAIGALVLMIASASCHQTPQYESRYTPPPSSPTSTDKVPSQALGPLGSMLEKEIETALDARAWPELSPSMDAVINGPAATPDVEACAFGDLPPERCTWGPSDAAIRAVLVGDSVAMSYAPALQEIAIKSDSRLQVHVAAFPGCAFVDDFLHDQDKSLADECPGRKQRAIDYINQNRPDIVFVSHAYGLKYLATGPELTSGKWAESLQRITQTLDAGRIVLLAAPPAEKDISKCYTEPASSPLKCASLVNRRWHAIANAEREVAGSSGWTWVDSRAWFCADGKVCPAFVGSTPVKRDMEHITAAYAVKIAPVMSETLQQAGVL